MQPAGTVVAVAMLLALWPAADNRLALADVLPAPPAGAGPSLQPQGELLLAQYQCGACHRIDGVSGATGTQGPALTHFGQRSYIAGRLPNTAPMLARWISDAPSLVPGTTMPALGVPPERARLMAAYLHAAR